MPGQVRRGVDRLRRALRLGAAVASLAESRWWRIKARLLAIWLPFADRLVWRQAPVRLRLRKLGFAFDVWVQCTADLVIVEEVLVHDVYAEPALNSPDLIVDLGSNIGASVLYFKARYPNARVVAIEPDPATCDLLRRNVGTIAGVTVHQAAIGTDNTSISLARAKDRYSSSTTDLTQGLDFVTVPSVTLDSLIGESVVDLLKIDVEGAEFAALKDASLERVRLIAGEIHLGPRTTREADAFERLLPGFQIEYTGGIVDPVGPWSEVRSFLASPRSAARPSASRR